MIAAWLAAAALAETPDAADSIGLVESLLAETAGGGPAELWLRARVADGADPRVDPAAPWVAVLREGTRTRGLLASGPRILDVAQGPTYHRVVLETTPPLSVVVVQDALGTPKLGRLEATSCPVCREPRRFVTDLLTDVAHGARAPRLSPGVELFVDGWLLENLDAVEARWVGAYVSMRPAAWLATALRGARVVGDDGDVVFVAWPNGREEGWPVRWVQDRWAVDYGALPADSVLRLPLADVLAWRDVEETPLRPLFERTADGVLLAVGVGAMAVDPRDETLVVASFAKDGSGTVARLDPATEALTGGIALPPHARAPAETWRGPGPTLTLRGADIVVTHEGRILAITGEQVDVSVVRTPMPSPIRPSRDNPAYDATDQRTAFLEGGALHVDVGGDSVRRLADVVDVAWAWDDASLVVLQRDGSLRLIPARGPAAW